MNHAEMTKHLRHRIKVAGIKASVRKLTSCGSDYIAVDVPKYGMTFSEDEQRSIRLIAKVNGLTLVRGMEIDVEQMTNADSFRFFMPT